MIARLSGPLVAKTLETAVVDAGGVGYEVRIPLSAYPRLPEPGERVVLHVHTHVREDAIQLYGFPDAEDKAVFELLIGVSGIGPRLAITLLSGLPGRELTAAIAQGRTERLLAVPGIGKKIAERLVLELKDRVRRIGGGGRAGGAEVAPARAGAEAPAGEGGVEADVRSALVNLGYTSGAAEKAIGRVRRGSPGATSLADLLRETLKVLST